MNSLIPQDTLEFLKSHEITPESASRVLRLLIKNEKPTSSLDCEIYLVLQILLATSHSQSKISEILASTGFPEDFASDFLRAYNSLPKIRAGVVLPSLVDVNWKTIHEISTSNIRKIHAPAIQIEPLIREVDGEFTSMSFTCTKPQLADLVYKLKSALQQIDKSFKS